MVHQPAASPQRSDKPVNLISKDGRAWVWRFSEDFGPWIRERRTRHGLPLRIAADEIKTSFTKLQKMETNGRVRPPSIEMLLRLANLYGLDPDEMLLRAGFKMEVPEDLRDAMRCDDTFEVLTLHPALRPNCMDERWTEAFSRVQKAQWIQFARKLDAHVRGGGASVDELVEAELGARKQRRRSGSGAPSR